MSSNHYYIRLGLPFAFLLDTFPFSNMDKINNSNTSRIYQFYQASRLKKPVQTRMWANAQPDGRPAEHRWRPLFNAAKFS